MRTDGLSFDRIPPLATPLGYFLLAPLFGLLAALILVAQPAMLEQRWLGASLAATHLLALGFGAQIMLGALYQVMPVVTGQPLSQHARLPRLIQLLLATGTLALATGFMTAAPVAFSLAAIALPLALLLFVGCWGTALWRVHPLGESARVLRLAAVGLIGAGGLGLHQALYHAYPSLIGYAGELTDAHLLWASLGWVVMLVMGVSLQVIPMFHVTPALPRWIAQFAAPALLAMLFIATLWPPSRAVALLLSALLTGAYAIAALNALAARKRKRIDYTVRLWQLALCHLLMTALALGASAAGIQLTSLAGPVGVVFGIGFMLSVMLGMLQKIVPFLIYLHLQRACLGDPMAMMALPNMQDLLPTQTQRRQWQLQLLTLLLLYLSYVPGMIELTGRLAGVAAAANFIYLGRALWRARQRFYAALPTA
ncbi:hypothetical protein [Motiliproteus sediminis]|uniref:hypothetical protein n=1 Tax=Motiliproteus sediminis TaxID=1468178 RepID=UPI001AEFCA55|nr:hypothetical protein [Motiliproteus sediminis]